MHDPAEYTEIYYDETLGKLKLQCTYTLADHLVDIYTFIGLHKESEEF